MSTTKMKSREIVTILFSLYVTYTSAIVLQYNISEGQGANSRIGNVAEDAKLLQIINNTQDFNKLVYSFLKQGHPHTSRFQINETSGELRTNESLDREVICEFSSTCDITLEVAAKSQISIFFETIKIFVTILDINDNIPTFPTSSVNLALLESSLVNTTFNLEGAIDKDSEAFSVKSYEILPVDAPFGASFTRNLDGSSIVKLAVKRLIDRETQDSYDIQVLAKDGGDPPKVGVLHVNITILDVNDNKPQFSNQNYNVTIKEDIAVNSTILTLMATDGDSGENGAIMYRISTNQLLEVQQLFSVNPLTGDLKIVKQLIYEPKETYDLIVEAYDRGNQPSMTQAIVHVYVQDSSNNPPEININLLSDTTVARISEYANMGAVVSHVRVIDNDRGANGIVTCNISGNLFQLQRMDVNEYKVIVQSQLDRETKPTHNVSVFCHDVGNPPLSANVSFVVNVTDENDQIPQFLHSVYNGSILEGNNLNEVIVQVRATDRDIGENAKIYYQLHGDAGNVFAIDEDLGIIRANKVFDRETKQQYKFYVYAIDKGNPPQSSTATVVVDIGDVNDNFPEFSMTKYTAEVQENLPMDSFVLQVSATDKDDNNNGFVTFSLPSNSDVPFFISPSGKITTTKALDREGVPNYVFTVIASDQGSPSKKNSIEVTVRVTDDNDNKPVIIFPNATNDTVLVSYLAVMNTLIAQVQAHDVDEGENKSLVFSIANRNDSDIFNINSRTGEIIVAKSLQRSYMDHYFLRIAVSDQGVKPWTSYETLHLVVAVRNVTEYPEDKKDSEQDYNIPIVVTVIVVTLVLSATIIITIFVIRRFDLQKRRYADAMVISGSKSTNVPPVAEIYSTDKKGPQYSAPGEQVGIYLSNPDNAHDQLSLNSQSTYQVSHHSALDHKPTIDRENQYENRSESPHDQARQSELNRKASIRLHQQLMSHDKHWTNHSEHYNKERPDNHSDTSGETIPSTDSGRGCSEDETRSTMSHSHNADDFKGFKYPVQLLQQTGRRGTPPHLHPHVRPQHHLPPLNHHHHTPPSPSAPPLYVNVGSGAKTSQGHLDLSYHLPPHVRTFYQTKPSTSSASELPSYGKFQRGIYLRQNMDDTVDSVATTGYDDDDNTTTSGSYTIDNDDYPIEIHLEKVPDVFV